MILKPTKILPIADDAQYCEVRYGTKEPIGKNWQKRPRKFENILKRLLKGDIGYGLILGETYSVVDIDNAIGRDIFKKHFGMYHNEYAQKHKIISWSSGKNFDGVYQQEINKNSRFSMLIKNTPEDWELLGGRKTASDNDFDIRTGNCQCILPSLSPHPTTGKPYGWVVSPEEGEAGSWCDVLPELLEDIDEISDNSGKLSIHERKRITERKKARHQQWLDAEQNGLSFTFTPSEFMEFVIEPRLSPLQLFDDPIHEFNQTPYSGVSPYKGNPFYRESSSKQSFCLFTKPSIMGKRWLFNDFGVEDLSGTAMTYHWLIKQGKQGYPNYEEQWEICKYYADKCNIKLPSKANRKKDKPKLGIHFVSLDYCVKQDILPDNPKIVYSGSDILEMSEDEVKQILDSGERIEIAEIESPNDFNKIALKLFNLGVKYILDASQTGAGKTHRTANTKPEDLGVEYLRYVTTVGHLNPTMDMSTWDASNARHGGTAYAESGRKFRTKHNAKNKIEPSSCDRAGIMQFFQDRNVPIPIVAFTDEEGNTKHRTALCTNCDRLTNCQLLREKFNDFKNRKQRLHPEQLMHSSEPEDGFYHPSKAVGILDEFEPMELVKASAYTLESFEKALMELQVLIRKLDLDLMPWEVHNYLIDLLIYLKDAKMGIHGISAGHDLFQQAKQLPDYDFEQLRQKSDDYSGLLAKIPDLIDVYELGKLDEDKVAKNIADNLELREIFHNFIPDLMGILTGKINGTVHIDRYFSPVGGDDKRFIVINRRSERLIDNINAFKGIVLLDATTNTEYISKAIQIPENQIITMKMKEKSTANLKFIQITGLSRLTKSRTDNQESRKRLLIEKIEQIHGKNNVGVIDFKDFIDPSDSAQGAWGRDSRGSNNFQDKKALVICGVLTPRLSSLISEYSVLYGKQVSDENQITEYSILTTNLEDTQAVYRCYECADPDLRKFIRNKILAETHQGFGRLRANRRQGEDLTIYLICDYAFDVPVEIIDAGEFCLESASKKEQKAVKIFEKILEINEQSPKHIKTTKAIIAQELNESKQIIQKYLDDLEQSQHPLWINRKYKQLVLDAMNNIMKSPTKTYPQPQPIKVECMDVLRDFEAKLLECKNLEEIQAVNAEFEAIYENWEADRRYLWKGISSENRAKIRKIIGKEKSAELTELFGADDARQAIEINGDRVECDERKLDIFSQTKIQIPEYAPANTLQPYQEIKKLYLDIETFGLDGKKDRVIMIGLRDEKGNNHSFWNIDEKIMLEGAIEFINSYSPQLLIGYNLINFDIPFLIERCKQHNIQTPFKLGNKQAKCSSAFVFGKELFYTPVYMNNCSVVDTYHLVLQYDNVARKLSKYDLKTATVEMGLRTERRLELSHAEISSNWEAGNTNIIENYLFYDLEDTQLLTDKLLPSSYYLKQFLPNSSVQDLIRLGNGSKWQMILDSLYDDRLIPQADDKKQYQGATTYANAGLHRNCAKIDVSSLYPSIMLKYGVCSHKDNHRKMLGVLQYMTNERLRLKELAKQGDKEADYKQGAMKIMINSAYGALGVGGIGYNDMSASALVTAYGRRILDFMLEFIESQGGVMVECDTDGIIFSHDNPEIIHEQLQAKLPEGINIELEWKAIGVYIPSDKNGEGLKKNYIVFKGGHDIKLKGKYRKREVCQIEREFPVEYLRLFLIDETQADGYYESIKNQLLSGEFDVAKLTQTRKIRKGEKQLNHLGNQGDIVTFWESKYGQKTNNISDGYNASYYADKIDEILADIKFSMGMKSTHITQQLTLF